VWTLEAEEELRIEIEAKGTQHKCTIQLVSGTAELFGTELLQGREYTFAPPLPPGSTSSSNVSGSSSSSASGPSEDSSANLRFAIFTWHGCQLKIKGATKTAYKKSDTPMISYLNVHGALENLRSMVRTGAGGGGAGQRATGPRCLVIGGPDSGKSTLCRILLSYAVRAGHTPIFIDLDVSQSAISIPGTISATSIESPISVETAADIGGGGGSSNTLSVKSPLTYFYGSLHPNAAPELYAKLTTRLAQVVERRLIEHPKANTGGIIVNTGGWADASCAPGSSSYNLIISLVQRFGIDVLLVVDRDDLTQALKSDPALHPSSADSDSDSTRHPSVHVAQVSRSGGVVIRDELNRKRSRQRNLRDYFYGTNMEFTPHQKTVQFKEVEIYRVGGGPAVPSSALPLGAKRVTDPTKVVRVTPSVDLIHHVLALSYAKDSASILESNVAGFVHVTAVDTQRKTLTILTPAPGPLPNNIFLCGNIKWID